MADSPDRLAPTATGRPARASHRAIPAAPAHEVDRHDVLAGLAGRLTTELVVVDRHDTPAGPDSPHTTKPAVLNRHDTPAGPAGRLTTEPIVVPPDTDAINSAERAAKNNWRYFGNSASSKSRCGAAAGAGETEQPVTGCQRDHEPGRVRRDHKLVAASMLAPLPHPLAQAHTLGLMPPPLLSSLSIFWTSARAVCAACGSRVRPVHSRQRQRFACATWSFARRPGGHLHRLALDAAAKALADDLVRRRGQATRVGRAAILARRWRPGRAVGDPWPTDWASGAVGKRGPTIRWPPIGRRREMRRPPRSGRPHFQSIDLAQVRARDFGGLWMGQEACGRVPAGPDHVWYQGKRRTDVGAPPQFQSIDLAEVGARDIAGLWMGRRACGCSSIIQSVLC